MSNNLLRHAKNILMFLFDFVPVRNAFFRMPVKMSKEGGKTHMHSTHNLLENMGLL
jgi:hypothetical protein